MSEETTPQTPPSLEDLLRQVIEHHADELPFHPWFDEAKRWQELVICLFFAYAGQIGLDVRGAVQTLDELGLLNVAELAALPWAEGAPDWADPQLVLMVSVLERLGFAVEDSRAALVRILRGAQDLQAHFAGRVQLYLRQQGQRMVAALGSDFPTLAADEERTRHAFTMWLQNALTMPLFLDTPSSRRFCEAAGCTLEQLYQAADNLDVSASLLDDVLDLWAAEEELLGS